MPAWFSSAKLAKLPWLWLVAALSLGGVIHILAVLSVPYLAERDAWSRLSAISSPNQIYVLPIGESPAPLPFTAPDIGYAFCRFDLSQKNVLLRPNLPDTTSMLAIYTRYGENFYFLTGAESKGKDLRLLLVPRERLARETVTEKTEEGDDQIIVITPSLTGIVLIYVPIRGKEFSAAATNALQAATCEPQKETEAQLLAGIGEESRPAEPPPAEKKKPRRGVRSYRE